MKRLLLLFLLWLPLVAASQDPQGSWHGTLDVEGTKLRLVFHLVQSDAGWHATLDSPDQGAKGIPVDSVHLSPSGITLQISPLKARYDGVFMGKDFLLGTFSQMGHSTTLGLRRGVAEEAKRPQEPTAPYPYRIEEVSFTSRDTTLLLNGTLTLPEGDGPHPAVVLITGSGTQNRDEELMGHRPFLVLADRLTRAGYAVLRYDDRGYGASPEEASRLQHTTTHHLMLDALGAFDLLAEHPAINTSKIALAGHSEGGTIALMGAAEEPRVAGVMSLAGMMVRGDELLIVQNLAALTHYGYSQAVAESYARALGRLYGCWHRQTPEELAANHDKVVREAIGGEPLPESLCKNIEQVALGAQNPWFYYFVRYNPKEAIEKLGDRPCLAINGAKDTQVDGAINLGRLRQLTGGKPHVSTKLFEGLNHLFQPCTTGAITEYAQIEITIDEEVLKEVIFWLDRNLK